MVILEMITSSAIIGTMMSNSYHEHTPATVVHMMISVCMYALCMKNDDDMRI
jgi:hypothetical protein